MTRKTYGEDEISKAIEKVEADTLAKLRKVKNREEPLDDVTSKLIRDVNDVIAAERALLRSLGRPATIPELAEFTGLPQSKITEILGK